MMRALLAATLLFASCSLEAAEPAELTEKTYKPGAAVLALGVNWGRTWKCGSYQNAQLQALSFQRSPLVVGKSPDLVLSTPSKVAVDDKFMPYAFVIEPGEYILTGFDVKVARSATDVGHLKGTEENLIKEGKPTGGTFKANPGEVVYIGHFGLDCEAAPFLWRYYVQDRKEFEGWVADFRAKHPFLKPLPVRFGLFETTTLGEPFTLPEPLVK